MSSSAMAHAIWAQFERGVILGNRTVQPEEFDGFDQLIARGLGQTVASANNDFRDFTAAFQLIKSHNRRVDLIVMNQDAWRRCDDLMRRVQGYAPDYKPAGRSAQHALHFAGVPVCISDHITTSAGQGSPTTIYFMSLGQPNGVFVAVHRMAPVVRFVGGHREDSPFESIQAIWFAALVSPPATRWSACWTGTPT